MRPIRATLLAGARPVRHPADRPRQRRGGRARRAGPSATYQLAGDPVAAGGSKFEGIGVDRRQRDVLRQRGHRRRDPPRHRQTGRRPRSGWPATAPTAGSPHAASPSTTRAGCTSPAARTASATDRPDLWVYDRRRRAARRAADAGATTRSSTTWRSAADGAAYFTNSNAPQVFRVADDGDGWPVAPGPTRTATDRRRSTGFNLGGIVLTADRAAFVVAQGNAGRLWRFDAAHRRGEPRSPPAAPTCSTPTGWCAGATTSPSCATSTSRSPPCGSTRRRHHGRRGAPAGHRRRPGAHHRPRCCDGRLLLVDSKFDEPVRRCRRTR